MTDREQYAPGPAGSGSAHVDALERHLDRMDQLTPTKKEDKGARRGPNRERDKGETK
jgi:hypothetical protein